MMTTVEFVAMQLLKKSFWYFVMATFIGVLMMSWRSWARNEIFESALQTIGKKRY